MQHAIDKHVALEGLNLVPDLHRILFFYVQRSNAGKNTNFPQSPAAAAAAAAAQQAATERLASVLTSFFDPTTVSIHLSFHLSICISLTSDFFHLSILISLTPDFIHLSISISFPYLSELHSSILQHNIKETILHMNEFFIFPYFQPNKLLYIWEYLFFPLLLLFM